MVVDLDLGSRKNGMSTDVDLGPALPISQWLGRSEFRSVREATSEKRWLISMHRSMNRYCAP